LEINFYNTKSGHKSFSIDNIFFHSKYSPITEAERFLSLNKLEYMPKLIILIEPGFSYLYPLLKKEYKDCKIGIVRFIEEIKEDDDWDFVISEKAFTKDKLLQSFSEEEILSTQFLCWPVSQKLFPKKIEFIYTIYKEAFEEAKSIIITRQYFEKIWLLNAFKNLKYLNEYCSLKSKIDIPLVITASGPSLKSAIPLIKKYQNNIFIMCLSSATKLLFENDISPDLILSSDGGYWAGQHLKELAKHKALIAAPIEAYIPKAIAEKNIILPLSYPDGLTKDFYKNANIPFLTAERNGSVSGTALVLAKSICSQEIYFCGLDLSSAKGQQHSQPNEIEINNCLKDNKIKPLQKRIIASEFNSFSLEIYRNWFCQQKNVEKIYRVIDAKQAALGEIKDINTELFENKIKNSKIKINKKEYFSKAEKITAEKKQEELKKIFYTCEKELKSERGKKQLFPLDYIALIHNKDDKESILRIDSNLNTILSKIKKLCGLD